ncbi:acylphosphatase [Verrucomicrobiaceae bacterium R5-34]|uniref:acylphosphatase n=1 Tax=Oceaniferula flava TaxID=2800421 RepID=A0AAE2V7A9_9BACT|nr:acylphosphatase [Oceaniferula flavus]MBK1829155.1 acylphosphatase [Verrucomicrobiaceae bacterium R5-34]MBK1853392.1 acylphosphatase [Oceaniferula flavus]MBM1134697.1 acylphosphatase [Oceaniferula flavus]
MIAKRVIFEGRVQGVGFRYATKQLAMGFDVCGWVKNLPEGTVEMQLMGEEEEVDEFIKEIVEESAMAHHIQNVYSEEISLLDDVKGFTISA